MAQTPRGVHLVTLHSVSPHQTILLNAQDAPDLALAAAASALDIDLQSTGGLSQIGRGKHTTRNVTLLQLPGGGLLADTPGFNQPELTMEPSELPTLFPEIVLVCARAWSVQ